MRRGRGDNLPIWKYFEKCRDGSKTAVCNYCHREFSFKSTVTNLKQHLRQRHNSAYNIFLNLAKNLKSVSESVEESTEEEPHGSPLSHESNTETPLSREPINIIKYEESNTEDPLFDSSPIAKRHRVQHSTIPNRQLEEEYSTKDESNCGENEENEKECELYGQLLATKLKPLDVDDRLVLMNDIDNLVFKYLLKIRRRSKLSNDKPGPSSRPY